MSHPHRILEASQDRTRFQLCQEIARLESELATVQAALDHMSKLATPAQLTVEENVRLRAKLANIESENEVLREQNFAMNKTCVRYESAVMPEEPPGHVYVLREVYDALRTYAVAQTVRADENERDARRCALLRSLYAGIDFEYRGNTVLIFSWPLGEASGHFNDTIDDALKEQKR